MDDRLPSIVHRLSSIVFWVSITPMSARYPIPAQETRAEIRVVNSRFVCTVGEARTVEAAQAFIHRVKAELHTASSQAYAYHIGFGSSVIDGCNDGGEPGGTAGRPMLAILQGSGLGDVVAVVSRWFGGTKLGTGGLVRAFGDSLRAALDELPRAERVERKTLRVTFGYPLIDRVKLLIPAHKGETLNEDYAAEVTFEVRFAEDDVAGFTHALRELSAGKAKII
ncbi:MAG TPA: YigZ family protein [Thermoflexales bacterium]|nr:YigZ family protein [Thermoflexales bacterium]